MRTRKVTAGTKMCVPKGRTDIVQTEESFISYLNYVDVIAGQLQWWPGGALSKLAETARIERGANS